MTAPTADAPPVEPAGPGEFLRAAPDWFRRHAVPAVAGAVGGGLFAYVVNVWLMTVHYDARIARGAPVTTKGTLLFGSLFWALAGAVLLGLVGYWRAVGNHQFWADARSLPRAIASLVRADGAGARIHLLWGAATGMLAALLLPPALGAMAAVSIAVASPTVIGSLLASLTTRAWSGVVRPIAPSAAVTRVESTVVAILGASLSLAVAFFVTDDVTKLVVAAACAGAALVLARRARPPVVALLLLMLATAAVLVSLGTATAEAGRAGADPVPATGGAWLRHVQSHGELRQYGVVGGLAGAVGGAAGLYLGDTAGQVRRRRGPTAEELRRADNAAILAWVRRLVDDPAFQQWRAAHPEHTGECSGGEFNAYMIWRHAQGLPDPGLVLPSQHVIPEAETLIDEGPRLAETEARASGGGGPLDGIPEAWRRYTAADGTIRDRNGFLIGRVDPATGRAVGLDGSPITPHYDVVDGIDGWFTADGEHLWIDRTTGRPQPYGNINAFDTSGGPPAPRLPGSGLDRAHAQFVQAGEHGEIYGPSGQIGQVDANGVLRAADGSRIVGIGAPLDGAVPWYRTEDGRVFDGDGRPMDVGAPATRADIDAARAAADARTRDWRPTSADDLRRYSSDAPELVAWREANRAARDAGVPLAEVLRAQRTPTGVGEAPPESSGGEPPADAGAPKAAPPDGEPLGETRQRPRPAPAAGAAAGEPLAVTTPTPRPGAPSGGDASLPAGDHGGSALGATTGDAGPPAVPTGDAGVPLTPTPGDVALPPKPGADWQPLPATPAPDEWAQRIGTFEGADPRLTEAYARLGDVKSFEDAYRRYVQQGYDERLAATLAATEVVGANVADASKPGGGVGTDLAMVGGAMLPEGVQSAVLPSKVVENYVRTGVDAWSTVAQSAGATWETGQLDLTAFDEFGARIDARKGADPFSGYSQAAGLIAEEWYRDDGGNLYDDWSRTEWADLGNAALDQSEEFRQAAEAGQHGTVLRGINDVFDVTAQVVTDPGYTLTTFFDDCIQIGWHGVGDGYWTEVGQQVDKTLGETPIVSTVYDGYKQVYTGITSHAEGESIPAKVVSGVGGFVGEMADGAAALAAEAMDLYTGTDTAKRAYDYVRSWF